MCENENSLTSKDKNTKNSDKNLDSKSLSTFERLHAIALEAPKSSGVYLWKNEAGIIIYVGKAKSLKNRLTSYFNSNKDIKTRLLVSQASTIEYIQTKNEYEALLLENTLIKKHSPKYNISLKDGKTYPMLKLTNEPFPRLYRTRTIYNDGSLYFGPFPNVNNIDVFLDMVKKNYKLHQCKVLKKRRSPCLYYHIARCDAPCCGKVSEEEYGKAIKEISAILSGNSRKIVKDLEAKMKAAVKEEDFEKATILRNNIEAINAIQEKTVVQDLDYTSRDYIAWASAAQMVSFAVLKMRGGRLVARDLYRVQTLKNDSEVMLEFFMSYYTDAKTVPHDIFTLASQDSRLAQEWLEKELKADVRLFSSFIAPQEVIYNLKDASVAEKESVTEKTKNVLLEDDEHLQNEARKTALACDKGARYQVQVPVNLIEKNFKKKDREHHYAALEMARFNAREDVLARLREAGDFPALEELKEVLKMNGLPYVIEGFDIAHLKGHFTIAGMVSFRDGKPDKKNYRIFKLKSTDGIIDDYKSMREAVARRYTRLINEQSELPDLILIDGGMGQVNAAWKILQALGLNIPLISLAEKNEEIYFPNNSEALILPRRSYALRLLQRVRDEVHHYCNSRIDKMNIKTKTTSVFEKLPHIGKKRAQVLIKKFATMEGLKNANTEEVSDALHVSKDVAMQIKEACEKLSSST